MIPFHEEIKEFHYETNAQIGLVFIEYITENRYNFIAEYVQQTLRSKNR